MAFAPNMTATVSSRPGRRATDVSKDIMSQRHRLHHRQRIALALAAALVPLAEARATTLKEMHDLAPSAFGYDRYIELETGVTYTGGLWIGGTFNRITSQFEFAGEDVAIVGNGAVLDLEGGEITIAYCDNRLDIENCVIINGDVKYRGYKDSTIQVHPTGYVGYVTFYKPHDYGVRLWACGDDVLVERNIVVDAVDTGPDFMYLTGHAHEWLPTGTSFSLSMQAGSEHLYDNWTFHTDPKFNGDPLRHFHYLCDYG